MIDVSDAFNDFLQPIVLRSFVAGTRDPNTGAYIQSAPIITTIQAVVQVANADDLLVLPEGERMKKTIKIHSTSQLKTANENDKTSADRIEYQGELFKVMSEFNRATIGGYYKALAVREGAL